MPGPTSLSNAEVDQSSIRLCVQSGLAAAGWTTVPVKLTTNGWPAAKEITPPVIFVDFGDSKVAGIELGSHGKERDVRLYVFATSEPMKIRLAEEVTNLFRDDKVSILNFVTGRETAPASVGRYEVDEVGWRSTPMPSTAVDVDKWRATVSATVRRVDA